jgi:hypothetical protein
MEGRVGWARGMVGRGMCMVCHGKEMLGGPGSSTGPAPFSPYVDQSSEHGYFAFNALEDDDIGYYDNDMENDTEREGDVENIRFAYRPETWSKQYASYDP